ncbi:MAG: hypothetical protein M1383_00385 [Patescibacteria group bacterium]|nr:hypothetical protein [Patescibacteria group bacterium]
MRNENYPKRDTTHTPAPKEAARIPDITLTDFEKLTQDLNRYFQNIKGADGNRDRALENLIATMDTALRLAQEAKSGNGLPVQVQQSLNKLSARAKEHLPAAN